MMLGTRKFTTRLLDLATRTRHRNLGLLNSSLFRYASRFNGRRIFSSMSSNANRVEPTWNVKELYMTTCVNVWEENPRGARFIVGYIDTASELKESERSLMPTILAVSCNIIKHTEFIKLLNPVAQRGYRIIMPLLAGISPTRGVEPSDDESMDLQLLTDRAYFLFDFIRAMKIQRFDMAIGHSLGCFPILALSSNISNLFKSVSFICPVPGHEPPRWIMPYNVSLKMTDSYKDSWLSPLASIWMSNHTKKRLPVLSKDASIDDLHNILKISHGIDYTMIPSMVASFMISRKPMLFVYCRNDPLIPCKSSRQYSELFGISRNIVDVYDDDCKLVNTGVSSPSKGVELPGSTPLFDSIRELDIVINELINLCELTSTKLEQKDMKN